MMRHPVVQLIVFVLAFLLLPASGRAQYWGERPMEKGFEHTEFFFTPSAVTPFGIGSFAATTPGLIREPLLDLVINPAYLRVDTTVGNYSLYTDFRASRNVKEKAQYIYPWMDMAVRDAMYIMPYPRAYVQTRKELEPVFSGAFISRILPITAPDLYFGLTYQLVLQDEKYYDVPSDLYKSIVGADYSGARMTDASIPIVDRTSADDNMHQAGHFISLFARYALLEGADIGVKLSRVMFDRNGAYGRSNLWDSYYSGGAGSFYANREDRDQTYGHWDLAAGVRIPVSDATTIGLSAGHLWGVATQSMMNRDTSNYGYYSTPPPSQYTSTYNRSYNKFQNWRHDGGTNYLSGELVSKLTATTQLTLLYRRQWSDIELGIGTAILDTSFSWHTYTNSSNLPATSTYRSFLSDVRSGSGDQTSRMDRAMAALSWQLDDRVALSIGAQLEFLRREISTFESVLMSSFSDHWNSDNSYNYRYGHSESKDLLWSFVMKRTSFRVPVFLTIKASEKVSIILALNRDMTSYEVNDATLAIFRYRIHDSNGSISEKRNFGESTREPKEEISDITTTFMAGITVAPSSKFQARMLVVPVFTDDYDGPELEQLQWWFGITVTP